MHYVCKLLCYLVIASAFPGSIYAQVESLQPRTLHPGGTTEVTVRGKNLAGLRSGSTLPSNASVEVKGIDDSTAKLILTLPEDAPLGPAGLWLSINVGPHEPFIVVVDDLPAIASADNNHSQETAQVVPTLSAIEGICDSGKSDFYKFSVSQGQRLAFQALSQPINSPMDPVLVLRSADGNMVRRADDGEVGPDCAFEHTFADAGDYFIEIFDSRFAGGHPYALRIGDFPIASGVQPLAFGTDDQRTYTLVGCDTPDNEFVITANHLSSSRRTVSARYRNGHSSSWFRIWNSKFPIVTELGMSADSPLQAPVTLSGVLSSPGELDRYKLTAVKGQTFRFSAITRQLDLPTLLRMSLHNSAGVKLAETAVTDADQWSFDYAVPEDGTYELQVSDLLKRGGPDFGYAVSIVPAPAIHVTFKADPNTRRTFALEPIDSVNSQYGAAAIPFQVSRFGYNGPIELSFAEPTSAIQIINPHIPAGVNEVLVYFRSAGEWQIDGHSQPTLEAIASEQPSVRADVSGLELHRLKAPHSPFPYLWDSGRVSFSAIAGTEPWFSLEPATPVEIASHARQHTIVLNIKRLREDFIGPVSILTHTIPVGWGVQQKLEGDTLTLTCTLPELPPGSAREALPKSFKVSAFAEHLGRGRVQEIELPISWFEPVDPQIEVEQVLVAGTKTQLSVTLIRKGADPQPVNLTLTGIPNGVVPEANPITIPADQTAGVFDLKLEQGLEIADNVQLMLEATGSYAGADFKISRPSPAFKTIGFPEDIVVYPENVQLSGSRDRQQMVVTGLTQNSNVRDWSSDCAITIAEPKLAKIKNGVIIPKANGSTEVVVVVGHLEKRIPLVISGIDQQKPIAFENEVLVALSKQGCNSGACHGSPSGKGGFRLSLRAFDKKLDELTLLREDFGRRINVVEPEKSLLLEKPLMKVAHGGGKQIRESDEAYAILKSWIAKGAALDPPEKARCIRLEVFPGDKAVLDLTAGTQQIAATAHFSDGTSQDVTHLVAYETTNTTVASVNANGKVTGHARGEAVILVRYLEHIRSIPLMFVDNVDGFQWDAPTPNNYIDNLVNQKLAKLQYLPAQTCTDSEFIRRVYLDVIGLLPTIAETQTFLNDRDPAKRTRLIDNLLERDEYARFWALKWGDLLKTTSKQLGGDGVYKYHRWVEDSLRQNMPYDQFAKELLTASGSTLANPPANFYRSAKDMNECVENISQVFLGSRLQCAKCHNHPFEHWTQDNYYGLGAFFQRVQRRGTQRPGEMFVWYSDSGEVVQPRTGQQMKPWLPGVGSIEAQQSEDRRIAFAEWLVQPDNPFFAKIEANRIWSQLFTRGIVDPIDDFRESNPATNDSLLNALAKDFVASGYDRKHLLRTILNSRTYQSSIQTNAMNEGDNLYFSHQVPRLLSAEQLLDAINHVTGISQAFGHLPSDTLATQLPAPDIVKVDFLQTFGQPERTTVCECEREDESNLGMAIELFNGSSVHEKIANPNNRFRAALAAGKQPAEIVKELYLAALCREPTSEELSVAIQHCDKSPSKEIGLEDICWALLNRDEFLFQH